MTVLRKVNLSHRFQDFSPRQYKTKEPALRKLISFVPLFGSMTFFLSIALSFCLIANFFPIINIYNYF